jgi:diguanylate cyclase (GGDEF)-like protein
MPRRAADPRLGPPGAGAAASPVLDPRAILTSIGEAVYDWNIATDAIAWSANAAEVFGLSDLGTMASGRHYEALVEPGSGASRHDVIVASPDRDGGTGIPYRTRYVLRPRADFACVVEDTGRWFADADGKPSLAHGTVRVDRSAMGDFGTGSKARERAAFLQQIAPDVAETARQKRSITLIVAAIEDVGALNDAFGCDITDELIEEVMVRIRRVMRRRDRLVRYSGNRFAVALLSCPSSQADIAAERIAQSVKDEPFPTEKGEARLAVRLGAATAPENAIEAAALLHRAEDALGQARDGRSFVRYDPTAARVVARNVRKGSSLDIIEALNARRIGFALQPIVEAGSREIAFHEALLRYTTADGRVVNAGDIIPSVERIGLVPLLDARILELAADHLASQPAARVSINLSPLTIEAPDFLRSLAAHLGARPGIESRLIVEVTETAAIRDPEGMRRRLDAMKALGISIAIDDFGAGHTSFRHLRSFPVDILKIDGAFVQNLARSNDDRFFVRSLVDLAHHLGIATVAEWVEDEESARLLAEWGVDYLQGEHCGCPELLPAPEPAIARSA